MKTKQIPALVALTAGLITCIISAVSKVSMTYFLKSLCLVIIIFFIFGCIIKVIMDKNFPLEQNETDIQEEQEENENQEEKEKQEKE